MKCGSSAALFSGESNQTEIMHWYTMASVADLETVIDVSCIDSVAFVRCLLVYSIFGSVRPIVEAPRQAKLKVLVPCNQLQRTQRNLSSRKTIDFDVEEFPY